MRATNRGGPCYQLLRESKSLLRYPSLDAAIADLREVMGMVEAGLRGMERTGGHLREPDFCKQTRGALEVLRDPAVLRARFAARGGPDGTVEFRFAPEAWDWYEKAGAFDDDGGAEGSMDAGDAGDDPGGIPREPKSLSELRAMGRDQMLDYLIATRCLSPLCSLCQQRLLTEIKAWVFGRGAEAAGAALLFGLCDECNALPDVDRRVLDELARSRQANEGARRVLRRPLERRGNQ